jgi:uncharacterized ubiquitin-like protein YukD
MLKFPESKVIEFLINSQWGREKPIRKVLQPTKNAQEISIVRLRKASITEINNEKRILSG